MRELVLAVIADRPDIEVIGEVQDESQLAEAIEDAEPDILILALDEADKRVAQCGFLLGRYPQMQVLALAPERNHGVLYWATVDVRTKSLESSEARDFERLAGTSIASGCGTQLADLRSRVCI